jgi:hypothetical protein
MVVPSSLRCPRGFVVSGEPPPKPRPALFLASEPDSRGEGCRLDSARAAARGGLARRRSFHSETRFLLSLPGKSLKSQAFPESATLGGTGGAIVPVSPDREARVGASELRWPPSGEVLRPGGSRPTLTPRM